MLDSPKLPDVSVANAVRPTGIGSLNLPLGSVADGLTPRINLNFADSKSTRPSPVDEISFLNVGKEYGLKIRPPGVAWEFKVLAALTGGAMEARPEFGKSSPAPYIIGVSLHALRPHLSAEVKASYNFSKESIEKVTMVLKGETEKNGLKILGKFEGDTDGRFNVGAEVKDPKRIRDLMTTISGDLKSAPHISFGINDNGRKLGISTNGFDLAVEAGLEKKLSSKVLDGTIGLSGRVEVRDHLTTSAKVELKLKNKRGS